MFNKASMTPICRFKNPFKRAGSKTYTFPTYDEDPSVPIDYARIALRAEGIMWAANRNAEQWEREVVVKMLEMEFVKPM